MANVLDLLKRYPSARSAQLEKRLQVSGAIAENIEATRKISSETNQLGNTAIDPVCTKLQNLSVYANLPKGGHVWHIDTWGTIRAKLHYFKHLIENRKMNEELYTFLLQGSDLQILSHLYKSHVWF